MLEQTTTGGEALEAAIKMRDDVVAEAAEALINAERSPNALMVLTEYVTEIAMSNALVKRISELHEGTAEEKPPKYGPVPPM